MAVAGRGRREVGQSVCCTICKMWFLTCLLAHLTQYVSNTTILSLNVLDYLYIEIHLSFLSERAHRRFELHTVEINT